MVRPLVIYIAARVVPATISVLFMVICAQTLSAAQYGLFSLILLPAMIAVGFAAGLAGQPMLRFATALSERAIKIGLYRVPLLVSFALLPFVTAYMIGVRDPLTLAAMALALVPLTALLDTRRNYLVSLSRGKEVFLLDALRSVVSIILLLGLVSAGLRDGKAPLLAMLGATAASLIAFSLRGRQQTIHGNAAVDRTYLLYGFWIACWLALIGSFPFLERFLLSWRYDVSTAGTYSMIADPLAALSSASVAVIVSAFMPLYVAAWTERRQDEVTRLSVIAVSCILALAIGVLAVGAGIRVVGIGKYAQILRQDAGLGVWLLIASTMWQISVFFHKPLELRSQTRDMFACLVLAAILFCVTAIPFVEMWGVAGIAIAKALAGTLYAASVVLISRRKGRVPWIVSLS